MLPVVPSRATPYRRSFNEQKDWTDGELRQGLFGDVAQPSSRKHPDYEYVHREMAKCGVTLSLLWHEYCDKLPRLIKRFPLCTHSSAIIINNSRLRLMPLCVFSESQASSLRSTELGKQHTSSTVTLARSFPCTSSLVRYPTVNMLT